MNIEVAQSELVLISVVFFGFFDVWPFQRTNYQIHEIKLTLLNGVICIYNNTLLSENWSEYRNGRSSNSTRRSRVLLHSDRYETSSDFQTKSGGILHMISI